VRLVGVVAVVRIRLLTNVCGDWVGNLLWLIPARMKASSVIDGQRLCERLLSDTFIRQHCAFRSLNTANVADERWAVGTE